MKFFRDHIVLVVLLVIGLLVPTHAFANNVSVPEPLSLALLGIGFVGLGAAELIRRRKDK